MFIKKKKNWIEKRILENSNSIGKINELKNGSIVFYLGNKYIIDIKKDTKNNVLISKNKLLLTYFKNKQCKNVLEDWYKDECKSLIKNKLAFFSKKIGVKFQSFSVKSYKLRLGSCSNKSNLSFNWKLIMMPEEVIDYVVIHELCHIIYFNHSKSFWNEVSEYCPDFKLHKKWIKKNIGLLVW